MSSLPDRRDSPRRRIRASGMHPGWACFMAGWGSGIFTLAALGAAAQWAAMRLDLWGLLVPAAIAIILFIVGARKAEKLTERD